MLWLLSSLPMAPLHVLIQQKDLEFLSLKVYKRDHVERLSSPYHVMIFGNKKNHIMMIPTGPTDDTYLQNHFDTSPFFFILVKVIY
jgi:hypothetical protein